ncbi:hypothetical protein JY97_14715 [Alkalispirochaeta odontotermitis]|nr:hypothetical protein JY97_14715 [Alkalispirochaeta odontotermitis]CAB1084622.1 hypothetical protein D1AOALGA4SA_12135 [Olavius algarvensis Delta 1 endosymbiont]
MKMFYLFFKVDRATCQVIAEGDLWGRNSKSEAPSLKRYPQSKIRNLKSETYKDEDAVDCENRF